ncbi:DNA protecting protein DprA [Pseudacidovorax intermedius]|uniref:DNA protecting protein DprA n=1 Tax=Pseudacidovorax intermedius TaxID=433924 RepID=A0A370FR65_9BURK|nr:DNA-processing protein DprA [Pseudacidovorax intermedius]RDI28849.1 DNA protecting protein DprA [Pseudacidovorax intermedius]
MEREDLAGWLRLALAPGVGAGTARRLLTAFGWPDAVFAQPAAALEALCSPAQARALLDEQEGFAAMLDRTREWLDATGPEGAVHRIVALGDAAYPPGLLEIADPPLILYLLGPAGLVDAPLPGDGLAIVGSRNPTPQGAVDARLFARALAEAGLPIVSGLALGVDGAAHEGALEAAMAADGRLSTIAVVGTGLDRVYPARHRSLAHRIAARGVILSEQPLGTPPLTANFPRRNRLISGLSQGTLVVEAALASGSLITARCAVEQGKEVFAIPGSIHSPQSRGCHALIRQGAKLVETAADVLEELRRPAVASAPATGSLFENEGERGLEDASGRGPEDRDVLLEHLGHAPATLDALCARTGLPTPLLQARLLELELDGRVGRLPGGLFQRIELG